MWYISRFIPHFCHFLIAWVQYALQTNRGAEFSGPVTCLLQTCMCALTCWQFAPVFLSLFFLSVWRTRMWRTPGLQRSYPRGSNAFCPFFFITYYLCLTELFQTNGCHMEKRKNWGAFPLWGLASPLFHRWDIEKSHLYSKNWCFGTFKFNLNVLPFLVNSCAFHRVNFIQETKGRNINK